MANMSFNDIGKNKIAEKFSNLQYFGKTFIQNKL